MPRDPTSTNPRSPRDRERAEHGSAEEPYELDLEAGDDPQDAIREAVAAVEAREPEDPREIPDEGDDELVRRLQEEVEDLRDRSIRTLADFENYRRRVERERDEHRRYAAAEVLSQFLEVVDNLERALAAPPHKEDLRRGVEMIHRQMEDLLLRLGAVPVPSVGSRFDPSWHEAVASEESGGVDAPTVIEEYQRGYRLHDRLLRPSRVRVAVPPEPVPSEAARRDDRAGED
jgi:molecular chaperone GrpE